MRTTSHALLLAVLMFPACSDSKAPNEEGAAPAEVEKAASSKEFKNNTAEEFVESMLRCLRDKNEEAFLGLCIDKEGYIEFVDLCLLEEGEAREREVARAGVHDECKEQRLETFREIAELFPWEEVQFIGIVSEPEVYTKHPGHIEFYNRMQVECDWKGKKVLMVFEDVTKTHQGYMSFEYSDTIRANVAPE